MTQVDVRKLKAELARQGSTLTKLARKTKTPGEHAERVAAPGTYPPPADLADRIEKALRLLAGEHLRPRSSPQITKPPSAGGGFGGSP